MNTPTIITATPDTYQTMLENYSSLVAKTNNELGLWLSVGNWMTTILGVLVAVIALAVAYAIWKNSEEQKNKFELFLDSQEATLKKNSEDFQVFIKKGREEAEKKIEILITKQREQLESATTENKQEIKRFIRDLEKEKATVGVYTPNYPLSTNYNNGGISYDFLPGTNILEKQSKKCSYCHKMIPDYQLFCGNPSCATFLYGPYKNS